MCFYAKTQELHFETYRYAIKHTKVPTVPNRSNIRIKLPIKHIFIVLFQIVFGIIFLIIGTVAFIEERGEVNLGLGIPAGGATIVAAGM